LGASRSRLHSGQENFRTENV
jgi:hypothetical protein